MNNLYSTRMVSRLLLLPFQRVHSDCRSASLCWYAQTIVANFSLFSLSASSVQPTPTYSLNIFRCSGLLRIKLRLIWIIALGFRRKKDVFWKSSLDLKLSSGLEFFGVKYVQWTLHHLIALLSSIRRDSLFQIKCKVNQLISDVIKLSAATFPLILGIDFFMFFVDCFSC